MLIPDTATLQLILAPGHLSSFAFRKHVHVMDQRTIQSKPTKAPPATSSANTRPGAWLEEEHAVLKHAMCQQSCACHNHTAVGDCPNSGCAASCSSHISCQGFGCVILRMRSSMEILSSLCVQRQGLSDTATEPVARLGGIGSLRSRSLNLIVHSSSVFSTAFNRISTS